MSQDLYLLVTNNSKVISPPKKKKKPTTEVRCINCKYAKHKIFVSPFEKEREKKIIIILLANSV